MLYKSVFFLLLKKFMQYSINQTKIIVTIRILLVVHNIFNFSGCNHTQQSLAATHDIHTVNVVSKIMSVQIITDSKLQPTLIFITD